MLISGATVVTVNDRDDILDPGWIAIRGGRITAVSAEPLANPGEESLDASGKVIIPGLINAHTHLFQTLLRGTFDDQPFVRWLASIYGCHRALSPEFCWAAGALGAAESALSGVTTVVDHQFLNRGVEWALATIDGIRRVGLRTVIARTIMDQPGMAPREAIEDPLAALSSVQELVQAAAKQDSEGMLTVMTGANTPGISSSGDLCVAVREFSASHGIRCSSHIAESQAVLDAVKSRCGKGVVEWLEDIGGLGDGLLAAHAVHVSPAEIDLMRACGVSVVHNPVSNMFLGDGIAPVFEFVESGINVGLGTDGASSNNSQNMFEVMKAAALLQRLRARSTRPLAPSAVLRMATINGARAIGLHDKIGSIEAGKRADLVILNLDAPNTTGASDPLSSLVYCAGPNNVEAVVVDGVTVVEQGKVATADEREILARAGSASSQLTRLLGS